MEETYFTFLSFFWGVAIHVDIIHKNIQPIKDVMGPWLKWLVKGIEFHGEIFTEPAQRFFWKWLRLAVCRTINSNYYQG